MSIYIVVTIFIHTYYDEDLLSGTQLDMTSILQTEIILITEDDMIWNRCQKSNVRVSGSVYNMSELWQQGDKLSPYRMLRADNVDAYGRKPTKSAINAHPIKFQYFMIRGQSVPF